MVAAQNNSSLLTPGFQRQGRHAVYSTSLSLLDDHICLNVVLRAWTVLLGYIPNSVVRGTLRQSLPNQNQQQAKQVTPIIPDKNDDIFYKLKLVSVSFTVFKLLLYAKLSWAVIYKIIVEKQQQTSRRKHHTSTPTACHEAEGVINLTVNETHNEQLSAAHNFKPSFQLYTWIDWQLSEPSSRVSIVWNGDDGLDRGLSSKSTPWILLIFTA
jgi:hypothetical protein